MNSTPLSSLLSCFRHRKRERGPPLQGSRTAGEKKKFSPFLLPSRQPRRRASPFGLCGGGGGSQPRVRLSSVSGRTFCRKPSQSPPTPPTPPLPPLLPPTGSEVSRGHIKASPPRLDAQRGSTGGMVSRYDPPLSLLFTWLRGGRLDGECKTLEVSEQ